MATHEAGFSGGFHGCEILSNEQGTYLKILQSYIVNGRPLQMQEISMIVKYLRKSTEIKPMLHCSVVTMAVLRNISWEVWDLQFVDKNGRGSHY